MTIKRNFGALVIVVAVLLALLPENIFGKGSRQVPVFKHSIFQEGVPLLQQQEENQSAAFMQADPNYVCYANAANITAEAIWKVMKEMIPGTDSEMSMANMLGDYFVSKGVQRLPCWDGCHDVAVGPDTVIIDNNPAWKNLIAYKGDLVRIDTGARYVYACSDVTRTFPVGAKFKTNKQRIYYNVLVNALKIGEAFASQNVGKKTLWDVQAKMGAYINMFGIVKYTQAHDYVHYIGTGTDVHGDRTGWSKDKPIQQGQFFALEIGLYIPEEGFGMRVEDTYAVLTSQVVRLSAKCPRDIDPMVVYPPISKLLEDMVER